MRAAGQPMDASLACWMLSKRHISISKLDLAGPDPWATWLALTSAPSALHDQVMMVAWASGELCVLPIFSLL